MRIIVVVALFMCILLILSESIDAKKKINKKKYISDEDSRDSNIDVYKKSKNKQPTPKKVSRRSRTVDEIDDTPSCQEKNYQYNDIDESSCSKISKKNKQKKSSTIKDNKKLKNKKIKYSIDENLIDENENVNLNKKKNEKILKKESYSEKIKLQKIDNTDEDVIDDSSEDIENIEEESCNLEDEIE